MKDTTPNIQRLDDLSHFMALELAEDAGNKPGKSESVITKHSISACRPDPVISQAVMPNGQHIRLLKTLLTSACERNCFYCPFRSGRDFRRQTFRPDEMANTFIALQRGGVAEGIFLSSGIAGGSVRTQDKLIDTIEILRYRYQYQGYVHLKLMPGAEKAQIEQAMRLADRVSLNLEAPNAERLEKLAPGKVFIEELFQPLRIVEDIRRSQLPSSGWRGRWPSMTTQFVVGAVGESDLEILSTTNYLHKQLRLARAYYSAFHPVSDTPLENLAAETPERENHLYQASFLLRDYGFDLEELPFDEAGRLPNKVDPKTAWAQTNLIKTPVEINIASPEELLRVPGIGPKGAKSIIKARRLGALRELSDLRRIGVNPWRPTPYILLDGQRPFQQLSFF